MNNKELIEEVKRNVIAYLAVAERLKFPKEEVEKQINLYLDEMKKLMNEDEGEERETN